MKKLILPIVLLCVVVVAVPAHAFLDYLFGGSSSRDAIDNSAIGDLRAWWTGNPAYQFNPYYSPQQQNPLQSQAPQGGQQMGYPGVPQMGAPQGQAPSVNYFPPQGGQQPYYGQYDPQPQQQYPMQQQFQTAPQAYQQYPQQPYQQAMPQQYQAAPQSYLPQGQPPGQYQPQAYPAGAQYPGAR